MGTIIFTVREISQAASGGSYVVGYTAEVEVTDNPASIEVVVLSTKPANADPEFVADAIQHTREGFADVLQPMNRGARVQLADLLLHDVDYKPRRQREFSAKHLSAALGSLTTGCS
ncbi:MAG: hypothetical protein ACIAXF_16790 [Phycisphaerales bacterium JB063]